MTSPGGFTAGDVLAAADMNLLPGGEMGYAEVTANQTAIGGVVDLTSLTVTFTAVSGRRYAVRAATNFTTNTLGTSTDYFELRLRSGSNTLKYERFITSSVGLEIPVNLLYVSNASISGSTTWKLDCGRNAGTRTIDLVAAASNPSFLLVEDIGPI